MNHFSGQMNRNNNTNESEKDIGDEFGKKLSINPDLPANTDFSGGFSMDTPNSFKNGNTPTTPFGLTHLQFPQGITISNYSTIGMQPTPTIGDMSTEELLSFLPKTPMQPGSGLTFQQPFPHAQVMQQNMAAFQNVMQHKQEPKFPKPTLKKTKQKRKPSRPKRGRSSSTGAGAVKDESRWKSWTREEEVFLVGAVMDRFFKRGSLSSTRADESTSDDSWSVIKNYYETAWKNYYLKTGISIPTERPANALSRHYKVMKARISQADITGEDGENFRTFFDEWETVFNVDDCLVSELNTSRGKANSRILQSNISSNFTKRKVRLSVRESPNQFV